jgi:hypothetical protein
VLQTEMPSLEERVKEAEAANEYDRSELCQAIVVMREALRQREWLASGRGCYEYDDDRWYKEFSAAFNEIHAALEGLQRIASASFASTLKYARTGESLAEARINIKRRLAVAEQALHLAARESLPEGAKEDPNLVVQSWKERAEYILTHSQPKKV